MAMVQFFLAMVPPTATHQEKQVRVVKGKPIFYEPAALKAARAKLMVHLAKYKPVEPLEGALQLVCKLLLCNGAVLAMYGLLLVLVPAGSISQELRTTALAMTLLTLGMGNVAFALYDRALCNLLLLYKLKWQPKLHKMLGMH